MKKKYGDKICLLYTDTDSFFYEIHTEDFYKDVLNPDLFTYFDTSDYPSDHPCFSVENKKVIGKFKDECSGVPIKEFIGLRAKLYTFKTCANKIIKKAKGIKKNVIKTNISFEDFKNCIFSKTICKNNQFITVNENNEQINNYRAMKLFRSKKHLVETVTCNKIALSNADDKRVVCTNKIDTLPYGHYSLE